MEVFAIVGVLLIVGWVWRGRKYDGATKLEFNHWLERYESAPTPLSKSRMAAAFLAQSLHFAEKSGAISSSRAKEVFLSLKKQDAETTMIMWLDNSLPPVVRAAGKAEVMTAPARAVGMLMLLAWLSHSRDAENNVRAFLFRR